MKSEPVPGLTRRGFIALAAAAPAVFKPRSAGLTQMLNEIDPMRTMMYACSVGTGWVTEFWPPAPATAGKWNPTRIMQEDGKVADRYRK